MELIKYAVRLLLLFVLLVAPLALALFLCGCSATVHPTTKFVECKDTRDGEVWRYDTATIREAWIDPIHGVAGATVTDTAGRVHRNTSADNAWLKCQPDILIQLK